MSSRGKASATRGRASIVGIYLGTLTLANGLGDPGGLVSIPILFTLKDHLHLGPQSVAIFEAITLLPHYLSFLFGALRDRWRPLSGDRAYLLLAAPVAACCYLWLATGPISYLRLLGAMTLAMVAYQMVDTASQALMTTVGQRRAMTGRLSALAEMLASVASLTAAMAGGWMIVHVSMQTVFLVAAALTALVFLHGVWKPREVFAERDNAPVRGASLRSVTMVFARRGVWLTLLVFILFSFSPNWGTPLFYYLTDKMNLSAEAFATFRAAAFAGSAAATAAYGVLCMRFPLRRLLWWAMFLNVFPGVALLAIRSGPQAIALAGIIGLLGGFGNVALCDLLLRSCPRDLEGTANMLCLSSFAMAGAAGDLLGAWLYGRGGFAACIAVDALATLLIIPLLARLPEGLTSFRDGEFLVPVAAEPEIGGA